MANASSVTSTPLPPSAPLGYAPPSPTWQSERDTLSTLCSAAAQLFVSTSLSLSVYLFLSFFALSSLFPSHAFSFQLYIPFSPPFPLFLSSPLSQFLPFRTLGNHRDRRQVVRTLQEVQFFTQCVCVCLCSGCIYTRMCLWNCVLSLQGLYSHQYKMKNIMLTDDEDHDGEGFSKIGAWLF
jgi:hypothetical protein